MNKESVIKLCGGTPMKCSHILGYTSAYQVYHWPKDNFKPILRASILRRLRFAGIEYPAEWNNSPPLER